MHKLYTWHPQRSIESQLLAGRMDGMTGRGLLIETEEEREPSWNMAYTEREGGWVGETQTGGGRRSSAKEEVFFFFFTPPAPPHPPLHIQNEKGDATDYIYEAGCRWQHLHRSRSSVNPPSLT